MALPTPARLLVMITLAALAGLFIWAQVRPSGAEQGPAPAASPLPPVPGPDVTTSSRPAATPDSVPTTPTPPPPDLGSAPEITDISAWLNTGGRTFDDVRGDVTVVQFWTFGCHNCTATIPHLQDLYAAHRDDGLEIIGVHAHEFDYERDPDNVAAAVVDLGITWPVALDTDKINFRAWQGSPRYWPRTYVVDHDGRIRFDHIGEGDYDELADTVADLLTANP